MGQESTIPADFGRRIRAARVYAGLSQEELADEIGMSSGYVRNLERGKSIKDLEGEALARRVSKVTGLPESFLLGYFADGEEDVSRWLAEKIDFASAQNADRVAAVLKRIDEVEATIQAFQRRRPA